MAEPNSTFILLAVILVLATYTDLRKHLIPNVLSLGGILIGLSMHSYQTGVDGLLFSLSGIAVGFFLFIPFYMLKGMAAGDVKLMAAIGAFMGAYTTFVIVLSTLICGSILAIAYIVIKGSSRLTLQRYWMITRTFFATLKWIYIKPVGQDAGALRFPYAIAIFVGTFTGAYIVNSTLPFYA